MALGGSFPGGGPPLNASVAAEMVAESDLVKSRTQALPSAGLGQRAKLSWVSADAVGESNGAAAAHDLTGDEEIEETGA